MIMAMVSTALSQRFIRPMKHEADQQHQQRQAPSSDIIKAANAHRLSNSDRPWNPLKRVSSSHAPLQMVITLSMPSNIPPQLRTSQLVPVMPLISA